VQLNTIQKYHSTLSCIDPGSKAFALMNKKGNYHCVVCDQLLWPHTEKVFTEPKPESLWPLFKSEPVGNVTYDKFEPMNWGNIEHVSLVNCTDCNSYLGQCFLDTSKGTKEWEMNSS